MKQYFIINILSLVMLISFSSIVFADDPSSEYIKQLFIDSCETNEAVKKEYLRKEIISLSPKSSYGYFCQGWILHNSKNYDLAVIQYKKALEIDPGFVEALVNIGVTFIQKKDVKNYSESERFLLSALRKRKDFYIALYNLGLLYLEMKNYSEADKYFELAVNNNENCIEAYNNLVLVNMEMKNFERAEKYALKAKKIFPKSKIVASNIGVIEALNGNYELAVKLLNENITEERSASTRMNIGVIYFRQEKYSEAKIHFKRAIQIDPNLYKAHLNLGLVYFYENDFFSAEKCFTFAGNSREDLWQAYYMLARLYTLLGSQTNEDELFYDAINELNRIIKVNNKYKNVVSNDDLIDTYSLRGFLYSKIKDYKQSIYDYEKCLELGSSHRKINRNLRRLENMKASKNNYSNIEYIFLVSGIMYFIFLNIIFLRNKISEKNYVWLVFMSVILLILIYIFPHITKLKIYEAELEKNAFTLNAVEATYQLER